MPKASLSISSFCCILVLLGPPVTNYCSPAVPGSGQAFRQQQLQVQLFQVSFGCLSLSIPFSSRLFLGSLVARARAREEKAMCVGSCSIVSDTDSLVKAAEGKRVPRTGLHLYSNIGNDNDIMTSKLSHPTFGKWYVTAESRLWVESMCEFQYQYQKVGFCN